MKAPLAPAVSIEAACGVEPPLHLGRGEVLVTVVHRLELAAVNGDDRFGEQIEPLAQHDELPAYLADRRTIVFAEVGNGLEVRHQPSGQPHQFDVALRLALQPTAGLDAIQVAP
jgi:hypothetical protein